MVVNGIIAEYNPFHNGHQYHVERSRVETGADYCVIVLSSNFTQRGEPAIVDKFTRARMALECGADLVLELPIACSASSAESFAQGGVSLLHQLGVVDHVCFGSECGDVGILSKFAKILLEEPKSYVEDLRSGLAAGHSYPVARNRALMDYSPELAQYKDVLSSPNNILGIEYVKAILKYKSKLTPHTILRVGSNYHDRSFGSEYCSALAIREAIFSHGSSNKHVTLPDVFTEDGPLHNGSASGLSTQISGSDFDASASLSRQMPKKAVQILTASLRETPAMTIDDFSQMLLYKLLIEKKEGYERYLDVTSELSDRIRNSLGQFQSYSSFCDQLKRKNMTYTRISRSLLHVLLGMTKEDAFRNDTNSHLPYARVLGFRKDAEPLLGEIKKSSSIPLVTKLADAPQLLSPDAMDFLNRELQYGSIYESMAALKAGRRARDERQIPIVIV